MVELLAPDQRIWVRFPAIPSKEEQKMQEIQPNQTHGQITNNLAQYRWSFSPTTSEY